MILVAPVWITQNWYPAVLELLIDNPRILKVRDDTLLSPQGGKCHPLLNKLHLMVCRISGNPFKSKNFRMKLQPSLWHQGDSPLKNSMPLQFCDKRKIDRFYPSVDSVIEFLTEMFTAGYSYYSLNTARSVLSSIGYTEEGYSIGSHPLLVKFMTCAFNLHPLQPKYSESFDISKVLSYLKTLPPVEDISLKMLSYKLAMLIALTRSQSLSLTLSFTLTGLVKDSDSYTLYYSSLLKQSRRGRSNPLLKL